MRKFVRILSIVLVALFVPILAFCQDGTTEAGFDPAVYFISLSALVTGVMGVTQWLKKVVRSTGNWTKFLSWWVAFFLSFAGWFLKLGIFAGIEWYWVLAYAIGAGLVANSVFDLSIVKGLLETLKSKDNGS